MLLNAEILLYYQRCHRRAFLDLYGDARQKEPESDFLLKLRQDSKAHRQTVLASRIYHKPDYSRGHWVAGTNATIELMQQGVDCIYLGALLTDWIKGVQLLSRPDLLVKQPGKSEFGDWVYVPQNIKLGKRSKLEYQISAAFDAQVLANIQGTWPDTAWLILRKRKPHPVNLEQRVPEMHQILADSISMLRDRQEPEVFISRQRCTLCPWYGSCYAIAQKQHHLSLLPGVTPNRYEQLQSLGITSLETLAGTSLTRLQSLVGLEIAEQLLWQAQATLYDRAVWKGNSSNTGEISTHLNSQFGNSNPHPIFNPQNFTSNVEFHFDLEAEPELDIDFMFGVLVVDRLQKTEVFHPLIAETPEDEGRIWQQFLALMWAYPNAPIFHFCDYEVKTTGKLAKRYNTPDRLWKPLLPRFVDIHLWVTQIAVLPIESYALKSIARWMGFEWRDPSANGAQCICWYNQWLETGDRTYLEAIVQYNEDDCRATYQVKEWLTGFWQQQVETIDN